ncbi:pilus assembly protein CpaB [Salinihabitans flavidus]|uniref:Pilus assembly protein CpaB n=1 Tax=Salinihabitans flavidus TaxID=569882 RepID=A0A1H8UVG0_9RHOB|nr:Flp pilus assembly protein CpaB [Salinihabitans flavidus]SEP06924.1 pilus assembly protein CpaB [Salinihabitans flavidus]
MRMMFAVVLLIGLGLAGFAVYMAQNYIEGYQAALAKERAERKPAIETVEVFVADRPLNYGEEIKQADVRKVKWPKSSVPEGVFGTMDDLFPEGEARLRSVMRSMEKNEAILSKKVTRPGEDAGITARLERGMRAFAIRVDVASGVSGFLRPGDRVDVYWTGRVPGDGGANTDSEVTKLIFPGLRLIAVDQSANQDLDAGTIARTVTVSATPQDVAGLAQAQSSGRLSLSLVGAQDDTISSAIEINQRSLLGIAERAEAPAPVEKEKVCTIRTRRGSEVVEIPIPCTN